MDTHPDTLYFRTIGSDGPEPTPGSTLPGEWNLVPISSRNERHSFYDTFENHAFQKGMLVVRRKGHLEVTGLDNGKVLAETEFKGTPAAFFPESLPEGAARELLLQCSSLRAFMKTCSVEISISSWRILDDNQKTIAILNSETMRPSGETTSTPFARFHSITPLKGYHRELARMLRALPEPVDAYRVTDFRERVLLMLKSCDHIIGDYSSKLRLQLDPEATVHENVRRLLQFTTSVMKSNETGIRQHIDTEFLHDYRVAIRRSRSIVRLLRGVFDPHRTAWLLGGLRDLGKRTNQLRDRDVYLLRDEAYTRLLPQRLRPALDRFFDELETERKQLHRKFCHYLASREYRTFMQGLETVMSDVAMPDQELAPNAALPTRTVASRSIRKSWKKVIIHGRKIGTGTPDSELHELRIHCKKLRYLLEFFSSLFPPKEVGRLVGDMKELQETLGDFVDLSVQIEFLLGRLGTLPHDRAGIDEAAALGGLVSALYRKQAHARKKFGETFEKFDDEQTRDLFDNLINSL
ncbi:MAG: CHAD domain-containing protein [Chlorobiaceae bacterium]|nr:CHAD domain-containing protein [Chlorobiaceae bacterium]NTW73559.1 CHAD domain-containing protein [Chlorobiaceae bacterium]